MRTINMENIDIDRIIEMCWEDRTPFEAIEYQFGLNEEDAIKIMRQNLKPKSFKVWRKRVTVGIMLSTVQKDVVTGRRKDETSINYFPKSTF